MVLQYAYWIGGALTGDLGISLKSNQPVVELVLTKLQGFAPNPDGLIRLSGLKLQ